MLLAVVSPVLLVAAAAIAVEGLLRKDARGPIFFYEDRIARGRVIKLMKFRILDARGLASLGPGPTHIATLERRGYVTRVGRVLKAWYLDELPQLWNIVRGDMGLIGTRPYPVEMYEEELALGITRKRDMPAGLIGPVQAHKGQDVDPLELDARYWEAFCDYPGWRLLWLDLRIVVESLRVQLQHRGL